MVKNPPSNAGYMGLIPGWWTEIPHATEQLSLQAATTEDCVPWSVLSLQQEKPQQWEAHAMKWRVTSIHSN